MMRIAGTHFALGAALAALLLGGAAGCRSSDKAEADPSTAGAPKGVTTTAHPSDASLLGPGPANPGGKGHAPRPVEPRPKKRPAREVLQELSDKKLYKAVEIRDETAKLELLTLYAPTTTSRLIAPPAPAVDAVQVVAKGVGIVPFRVYEVRVTFWWDEVRSYSERGSQLRRASRLESIDVSEIPPPTAEYTLAGKRAIRLRGAVRISTAGFDSLSVASAETKLEPSDFKATSEQEALDRLTSWMDEPDFVTPTFERAIQCLPPQVVVEHLLVSRKQFELALAGIDEKEAVATAERLVAELAPSYEEPRLSRRADTFVISSDRKR